MIDCVSIGRQNQDILMETDFGFKKNFIEKYTKLCHIGEETDYHCRFLTECLNVTEPQDL